MSQEYRVSLSPASLLPHKGDTQHITMVAAPAETFRSQIHGTSPRKRAGVLDLTSCMYAACIQAFSGFLDAHGLEK